MAAVIRDDKNYRMIPGKQKITVFEAYVMVASPGDEFHKMAQKDKKKLLEDCQNNEETRNRLCMIYNAEDFDMESFKCTGLNRFRATLRKIASVTSHQRKPPASENKTSSSSTSLAHSAKKATKSAAVYVTNLPISVYGAVEPPLQFHNRMTDWTAPKEAIEKVRELVKSYDNGIESESTEGYDGSLRAANFIVGRLSGEVCKMDDKINLSQCLDSALDLCHTYPKNDVIDALMTLFPGLKLKRKNLLSSASAEEDSSAAVAAQNAVEKRSVEWPPVVRYILQYLGYSEEQAAGFHKRNLPTDSNCGNGQRTKKSKVCNTTSVMKVEETSVVMENNQELEENRTTSVSSSSSCFSSN